MGVFCVCVMKEQETEIERQTWRKWGRFLVERHAAGSRLLSPCPMPLECSFVVWTPTRPLFVLRRWGLAECDRALTPEAIRGGGNNTFIPCDASALIPPMFLATNWPRGPPGCAAHLHTNAKKPTVNQLQSQKKKIIIQSCMCRYINGNLNVRFSSCLNAQFDICIKGKVRCLTKLKNSSVHYWDWFRSCYTQNIEILIRGMTGNQCQINYTGQTTNDDTVLIHLHITFVACYSIPVIDRQTTATQQCLCCRLIKSSEMWRE